MMDAWALSVLEPPAFFVSIFAVIPRSVFARSVLFVNVMHSSIIIVP